MRVFGSRSKYVNGRQVMVDVSCNLSIEELQLIKVGLKSVKPFTNDQVMESVRSSLVLTLEEISNA